MSSSSYITDGQIHVWAAPTLERPWRQGNEIKPQRDIPFSPDDALAEMNANAVTRALLVPPTWEGPRNDLVLQAAKEHPDRFAVMGRLDPGLRQSAEVLTGWRNAPGMLGVRLSINRGDQIGQISKADSVGFFAEAETHGVPLTLFAPGIVPEIGRLAQRYPKLRLVIDHLALDEPDRGADLLEKTKPLLELAALENVAVKLSALPCFLTDPEDFTPLQPLVHRFIEAFGPTRSFWGSDLSRLPCSYSAWILGFRDLISDLTDEDQAEIWGRGICRWLGWHM